MGGGKVKQIIIFIGMLMAVNVPASAQEILRDRIDKSLEQCRITNSAQDFIDILKIVMPEVGSIEKEEVTQIRAHFEKAKPGDSTENQIIENGKMMVRLFELLLRIDPTYIDRALQLSETYTGIAVAFQDYHMMHNIESNRLVALADDYTRQGIKLARKLVAEHPGDHRAFRVLSYALYQGGKDLNEAQAMVDRCIELDKENEFCRSLLNEIAAKRRIDSKK